MEPFIPIVAASLLILSVPLLAIRQVVRSWENRHRGPFSKGLLRPPGFGCLGRIADHEADTLLHLGAMIGMAACLPIAIMAGDSWIITILLLATMLGVLLFGSWKAMHHLREARIWRMGYLGELAVAEALSELPRSEGWRVFHDVRLQGDKGQDFNIDHVVVGTKGVFAVETKAWSKFREEVERGDDLVVEGDRVSFPRNGTERREYPLKQAKRQACALRNALEEQTGHLIYVHAQVVTPGWTLFYKGQQNKQICEVGCVASFLEQVNGELPDTRRKAIVALLDAHCRDLRFERADNFLSAYRHHAVPASEPLPASRKRRGARAAVSMAKK